jgi:hypothetical protein
MRVKHFVHSNQPEQKRTRIEIELRMMNNRRKKRGPITLKQLNFINKQPQEK